MASAVRSEREVVAGLLSAGCRWELAFVLDQLIFEHPIHVVLATAVGVGCGVLRDLGVVSLIFDAHSFHLVLDELTVWYFGGSCMTEDNFLARGAQTSVATDFLVADSWEVGANARLLARRLRSIRCLYATHWRLLEVLGLQWPDLVVGANAQSLHPLMCTHAALV